MIEASTSGCVGRISLNRPEAHNALDQSAMRGLNGLLEEWAGDRDLRVLVLTGTGRSFCAGASLDDVAGSDWTTNPLTELCNTLEAFPVPTIAKLNGGAYGGGVELALACDFRIGATGIKAFAPPARLGIHYEPAGIRRVIDRLGSQTARRIFLLAERLNDKALLDCGFLDRLVPPEHLDSEVDGLVTTVCELAPIAVRGMKRTILELSYGKLNEQAARDRIAECFSSEDFSEGLAAQSEKRAPKFTGR